MSAVIYVLGVIIIISIGVIGCMATLDEVEYRNGKWRDEQ